MEKFDRRFWTDFKNKCEIDLVGVAAIGAGTPAKMKEQAAELLPGAKSVLVFGREIFKEVVALLEPSKEAGSAAGGEILGPHSDYLNGRLSKAVYDAAAALRGEGYRVLPLSPAGCPTDQRFLRAMFSYKQAAVLAGLGSIGRHSMVLTAAFGPRVRLACLLTDAPLKPWPAAARADRCLNCNACIRACPAQAIQAPAPGEAYAMNPFACRTYRQAGLTCGVCMKACAEVLG